jgi:GNAT superfamily N-acetyltransferase
MPSPAPRRVTASGLDALRLVTELLQRARLVDPEVGVWDAADVQWWWRTPRRSDVMEQVFWLDDRGPVAAVMLTDWVETWGCDPITLPAATSDVVDLVWGAAMERAGSPELDGEPVETLVRDDDDLAKRWLTSAGFRPTDDRGGMTAMAAGDRPTVEPLPPGFTLVDRGSDPTGVHWLTRRSGSDAEPRLRQVSLYDPSLDLAIRAPDGSIAGYALFWFDPATRVGLLEPMRVEEAWQRRGLARSLIAHGLDRLARKGATRMHVNWGSPPGHALYLGAGFRDVVSTTTYRRGPARASS